MEGMQYYLQLIQQGYPPLSAAQYTKQYFPEFEDPIVNPSLFISPNAASIPQPSVQNPIGLSTNGLESSLSANLDGNNSRKKIFIASILILGLVGTGGYFLYDYLTKPDFYGEIYWVEDKGWGGVAIIFEEDGFSIGQPLVNGSCDFFQDKAEKDGYETKKSNGICKNYFDMDEYSSEDKGDYYEICTSRRPNDCSGIYIFERGMIMNNQGVCSVHVSDINPPPSLYEVKPIDENGDLDYGAYEEYHEEVDFWLDDWYEVAEEIMDDDDAPSCFYDFMNDDYDSPSGGLDIYIFRDRDVRTTMSNEGGEGLVFVLMVQGEGDGLSRNLLSVSIIVDGGASLNCQEFTHEWDDEYDEYAECTWWGGDEDIWEVYDEIYIAEGPNTNLCDGSNGGCTVDITLTKIGVGGEDSRVIAQISAYADAN